MNKISFAIGVYIESEDRLSNLDMAVDNLLYHFPDSEIILSEMDTTSKISGRYKKINHIFTQSNDFFCRVKAFNIAAYKSTNNVLSLYDADVIIKNNIIQKCADLINEDKTDLIYPYNGYFYDVPKTYHSEIKKTKNLNSVDIEKCTLLSNQSVGGVVFGKRDIILNNGCYHENFLGPGYEDNEFYDRFVKLGFRVGRINSNLFHMSHERKETSFDKSPYVNLNKNEYLRIHRMDKNSLREEINKWNLVRKFKSDL
jgi:predicted glycosyltransferase involved in capsule biosynthesis